MARPLGTLILVKPFEKEMGKDGITWTANTVDEPEKGTIIEIGEKVNQVKIGDEIIFRKAAFTKINIDGEIHLLMDITSAYMVL